MTNPDAKNRVIVYLQKADGTLSKLRGRVIGHGLNGEVLVEVVDEPTATRGPDLENLK